MRWFTQWFKRDKKNSKAALEAVHVTLEDVRRAVLQYEKDMPKEIKRTTLLLGDQSIDLKRLRRYLGGESDQKFYMSHYTYEIFEEKDKHIPVYLDMVQAAVDDYLDEHDDLPVLTGTRNRKVHYDLLMQRHYLKEKPPISLYLTTEQFLLTHEEDWHKSQAAIPIDL